MSSGNKKVYVAYSNATHVLAWFALAWVFAIVSATLCFSRTVEIDGDITRRRESHRIRPRAFRKILTYPPTRQCGVRERRKKRTARHSIHGAGIFRTVSTFEENLIAERWRAPFHLFTIHPSPTRRRESLAERSDYNDFRTRRWHSWRDSISLQSYALFSSLRARGSRGIRFNLHRAMGVWGESAAVGFFPVNDVCARVKSVSGGGEGVTNPGSPFVRIRPIVCLNISVTSERGFVQTSGRVPVVGVVPRQSAALSVGTRFAIPDRTRRYPEGVPGRYAGVQYTVRLEGRPIRRCPFNWHLSRACSARVLRFCWISRRKPDRSRS